MSPIVKQRDCTFDTIKFLLIVLVVFGHWLEYGLNYSVNRVVFNYIYLFHMPFFILISGYFSRKKDKETFMRDVAKLIETYIVVQILYVFTSFLLQNKPFSLQQLYMPNAAAWFLLSLFTWRIALQMMPRAWLGTKWIIPLSVGISLAAGFLPVENELSLQRTLAFFPFFIVGYKLKNRISFGGYSNNLRCFAISFLVLIGISSFVFLNRDVSYVTWCKTSYFTPPHSLWTLLLLRALYFCTASLLVFSFLAVFPVVEGPNMLSRLGRDTLFFYVYHIIVMRIGIIIIRHLGLPLYFPAMICYTLGSVAVLYLLSQTKPLKLLLNPASNAQKMFKHHE